MIGANENDSKNRDVAFAVDVPARVSAVRYVAGKGFDGLEEEVTVESPLTVFINGDEFATVVCSPWEIEYMAVGFLCSEGILRTREALGDMTIDRDQGIVHVDVAGFEENVASKVFLKRYINSCCGRSRASFYYSTDAMLCKTVGGSTQINPDLALELMELGHDAFEHVQAHRWRAWGPYRRGIFRPGAVIS